MGSDDIRKLIEAFNKAPLKNVPDYKPDTSKEIDGLRRKLNKHSRSAGSAKPKPQEPVVYSRFVSPNPLVNQPVSHSGPRDFGPPVTLEEVIEGTFADAPVGPGYLQIDIPANDLESEAALVHRRFLPMTGYPEGDAVERWVRACRSQRILPDEIVFLDLETTGLSMTPVFLIGTMECTGDGFLFRQYFARDYSEEASILSAFARRLESTRLVITFNGKSFDMPFLANRGVAAGVSLPVPDFHLDLLHEARRVYKKDLPNCRLQTLERYICGRERDNDIPGSEIPAAYHEFVRTGNANKIRSILMHNLYDIFTMADLMSRMWRSD